MDILRRYEVELRLLEAGTIGSRSVLEEARVYLDNIIKWGIINFNAASKKIKDATNALNNEHKQAKKLWRKSEKIEQEYGIKDLTKNTENLSSNLELIYDKLNNIKNNLKQNFKITRKSNLNDLKLRLNPYIQEIKEIVDELGPIIKMVIAIKEQVKNVK